MRLATSPKDRTERLLRADYELNNLRLHILQVLNAKASLEITF